MTIKTVLTSRGYAIIKEHYSFKDINRVKKELTVSPYTNDNFMAKPTAFPIYMESHKKLYLPKHYGIENFGTPDKIKDDNCGNDIDLEFTGELRPRQELPVNTFLNSCSNTMGMGKSNGGIISIECGGGKTVIALNLIAKLKKKTLIIVHKEFLMDQWKERIEQFLPDARVGRLQGSIMDINNKDIVLAMLQSVSMKEFPVDTFKSFGFTVVDEAHHIAAEVFSRALPKINTKYSLGLSATPTRKDGLTKVFFWYLGPMVYKAPVNKEQTVIVNVVNYKNSDLNYSKEELTGFGKKCMPKMINNICNFDRRLELIIHIIIKLRNSGKKILILSGLRKHLEDIHNLIIDRNIASCGYYVGGMKQKDLKISQEKDILLATFHMASEGMDIPDLDAVIFASPKSDIVQSIGRILRKKHDTPPIAWDICDDFSLFTNQFKKRKRYYKKMDYPINMFDIEDDSGQNIDFMINQI